jgi:hypothetical protein
VIVAIVVVLLFGFWFLGFLGAFGIPIHNVRHEA